MKSYISYNLFRNRTKFNPLSLFYSNKDMTYEEFKVYFNSRDIESPNLDYYNRVKDKFIEINIKTENINTVIEKEESDSINKSPVEKQKKSRSKSKKAIKSKAKKDENN